MTDAWAALAPMLGPTAAAELAVLAAAHALARCAPYRAWWRPWLGAVTLAGGVLVLRGLTLADVALTVVAMAAMLLPAAPPAPPPATAAGRRHAPLQRWLWVDLGTPLVVLGAWLALRASPAAAIALAPAVPVLAAPSVLTLGATLAAYAWVCRPASEAVAALLEAYEAPPAAPFGGPVTADAPRDVGWLIGTLERLAVVTLTCLGQWEAVGLVFTAKSIVRFREMRERGFAELYLTGTLASVGLGGLAGLALRAALGLG